MSEVVNIPVYRPNQIVVELLVCHFPGLLLSTTSLRLALNLLKLLHDVEHHILYFIILNFNIQNFIYLII